MRNNLKLSPELASPPSPPPSRLSSLTPRELRHWARTVYPLLLGMSWRQVQSNRRKWLRSIRLLGDDWLLFRAGVQHKNKSLRVARR
jgi:hypothetical protein